MAAENDKADNAVVENEDSSIEELPGNYPFNKSYNTNPELPQQ